MFISPLLFRKRALFAVGPPRDPPEVPQPTPGAPRGVRGGCVTDGDSDVAAATPVNAGAVTPRAAYVSDDSGTSRRARRRQHYMARSMVVQPPPSQDASQDAVWMLQACKTERYAIARGGPRDAACSRWRHTSTRGIHPSGSLEALDTQICCELPLARDESSSTFRASHLRVAEIPTPPTSHCQPL